jgi:molecular chaperone GrpE
MAKKKHTPPASQEEETRVAAEEVETQAASEAAAESVQAPPTGEVEAPEGTEGEAEPADETASLKAELESTRTQMQEYLDGWQRERAAFANYRRRVEEQQEQARRDLVASIARRYLEVLDDLELALKNKPTEGEGAAWAEGIELIYRKMLAVLEAEGVKPMETHPGDPFDPRFHEAITHEPHDEHESEAIIEVVRRGYLIGDQVLRPALVRVAQ